MTAHGLDDEVREVAAGQWAESVSQARDEGFTFCDLLDCVDEIGRSDEFRVLVRLVDFNATPLRGLQLHTRVPRSEPLLASLAGVFTGAAWHERELHDFFGIRFQGGDDAPLLVHRVEGEPVIHPLRKDVVLAARTVEPWPGAREPGESAGAPSRRRMAPPGVPEPEVWGARDPEMGSATAEELAQAVAGGRVRRRR